MNCRHLFLLFTLVCSSCSFYQPLKDPRLYPSARRAAEGTGVTVTYLGNCTMLISDQKTNLLVDGFFSRPGGLQVLCGKVSPNKDIIKEQLKLAGIEHVDALLVGHTHYDHALDAPMVARETKATVMASRSYSYIQKGDEADRKNPRPLIIVPACGMTRRFGDFEVTFRLSEHIAPHLPMQAKMEGHIISPVSSQAPATDYKCDDVFVIHIKHPQGSLAITTTAGAREGQFDGLRADVLMLAVGLFSKEPCDRQKFYWRETVGKLNPHTVIPVHWDTFTKKLDDRNPVRRNLAAPRAILLDHPKVAMEFVKSHAGKRDTWVMGLRDSFLLRGGKVCLAQSAP